MFECTAKYGPPLPAGVPNPRDWGEEEIVRERLGPYAAALQIERVSTHWEFESFEQAMQTFAAAGPSVAMQEAMTEEQRQQLATEAVELMQRHNKGSEGRVVLDPEYLQVVARKRG
jgi:hypothetical protein